jgi:hypothetical protein
MQSEVLGGARYAYDAADRLIRHTDSTSGLATTYGYNGLGDRLSQSLDGTTT